MSLERRFSENGTGGGEADTPLPERHRKADKALSIRYEQLAKKWAEAEEYFRSLHLPRPVLVVYNMQESNDPGGECWETLGFLRHGGEWRLCHAQTYGFQEDEPIDWKPVVDCNTDVRLEAASKLGELKIEAAKAKEEYISRVDKALQEMSRVLEE